MNDTAYPDLDQFMGCYFHQDKDIVHGTDAQAIDDFIRDNWREVIERVIEDIDRFLRDHLTGLLAAFETEFEPDFIIGANDDEARAWLIRTRDQLQSGLEHAPLYYSTHD